MYKYMNFCRLGLIGCCFKNKKLDSDSGSDEDFLINKQQENIILDTRLMGNGVVVIKNGQRVCGSGSALANVDILQDKAYFEIRIQALGFWSVGVATTQCNLSAIPPGKDDYSWVLLSDGSLWHSNVAVDKVNLPVNEGDYIGIGFDHVELNFFLNGKNLHCPLRGIKGVVRPIICVDDGCIIDVSFSRFIFPPPPGFQKLMVEVDLL
ncbi:SPRY domain-containing protein 7 isoform X2 [Hydra vulgaris]|uniref:SPRY domain-containing protein 7 n=1 Tax=Hydra vulgaris TaxID=6087 RepID=A0ABM4B5H5_HYDVU